MLVGFLIGIILGTMEGMLVGAVLAIAHEREGREESEV